MGYHIVNLIFHIGSVFLLYLIIKAMLGGFYISLASALIFAVHPFNSEVVNYIKARSSVMSGFFYLLAFYCWVRFRSQKKSYFYIGSLLAFISGMLSKEVVITLPVMLLLYDVYFIPVNRTDLSGWFKGRLKLLLPVIPFIFIVVVPYLIIRVMNWGQILTPFKRTPLVQLYTELPVLVKHLKLFILPVGLNIEHYHEIYIKFFVWPV